MPIYEIIDNLTGKRYELEGEYQPNQEQVLNLVRPSQSVIEAASILDGNKALNPDNIKTGQNDYTPRETAIRDQTKKINNINSQFAQPLPSNKGLGT